MSEIQTYNKLSGKRNLYVIWQTKNNGYDTYSDAVVAAWTEEEARNIHPCGYKKTPDLRDEWDDGTWAKPDDVMVQLIGVAESDEVQGVVCSSFHAG